MEDKSKKYMNPYLAGYLLGLVLLSAFFFTGSGLGASGAMKNIVTAGVDVVSHKHALESHFFSKYVASETSPLKTRLIFMVLGVFFGGLLSGALMGRLKAKVEHSPKITSKTRLIMATIGGALFGIGSQLGRGCTSGAALSGMASLSAAGFLTMLAIFGTGYAGAYFFRKFWI